MPSITGVEEYIKVIKNDPSKLLSLKLGDKKVSTGEYLPRAEATSTPDVSFAAGNSQEKYVTLCVDLDGPYPSFNFLSPILHWIQSDLHVSPSTSVLSTKKPFIANYIGPGPPPGSAPHRYVFLLYRQPSGFNLKDFAPAGGNGYGNVARMRFDVDAFEAKANLGSPIAVNYFTSN